MAHTNSTTHYALPQFVPTDKPAWLTDINGAFSDIDTAIDTAQTKADDAYTNAGLAQGDATTALTNAAAADAKGAGALASIEAAFDPTTIYSVGAKVIYNSLLYRCIVAVVTPGPWTGSDNWERINVDGLISTVDSKIGSLPSLSTVDKSSVVNAINEVNGKITDWTMLGNYAASATADISSIFSTAKEIKVVARSYTTGQLGSSQVYSITVSPSEITDLLSGGFTELHYLQGMNNGQPNVIDFDFTNTNIRIATFLLNGVDVKSSTTSGFRVYYR